MIWIIWALVAVILVVMISVVLTHITAMRQKIAAQFIEIFTLRQEFKEFKKDQSLQLTDWGKELKVCILSLQTDVLRNRTVSPLKKDVANNASPKKKVVRSAETKKKISDKAKERWAEQKRKEAEAPSLFALNSN